MPKYLSPHALLKFVGQSSSKLNMVAINVMKSQVQMKLKFSNDDLVVIDGVRYRKGEILRFLNTLNTESDILFHNWIYSMEGLHRLLTDQPVTGTFFKLPQEIRFSSEFEKFRTFLAPFLAFRIKEVLERFTSEPKYAEIRLIIQMDQLVDKTSLDKALYRTKRHLQEILRDPAKLKSIAKSPVGKDFDSLLRVLPADFNDLVETIRMNSSDDKKKTKSSPLSVSRKRSTTESFHPQNAPRNDSANRASERLKNQYDNNYGKKSTRTITYIIAASLVILISTIIMSKSEDESAGFNSVKERYTSSNNSSSDYSLNSSTYEEQIALIEDYVQENKSSPEQDLKNYSDYNDSWSLDMNEPFMEFFYPLYNKDGSDGWRIVNETDYAIILLIESRPDCYSYLVESQSTANETFCLLKGDRLQFYAGKRYEQTRDLMRSSVKGFGYVDTRTNDLLEKVYMVGKATIDPLENSWDDGTPIYNYEIRFFMSEGQIQLEFDYYRLIEKEKEVIS